MSRTNCNSNTVQIKDSLVIGEGAFRVVVAGTFIGGSRNNQEAACKRFKHQYRHIERDFFETDSLVTEKAIQYALEWNAFCRPGKEIFVNSGSISKEEYSGRIYLIEPLIKDFIKFTSNNGMIIRHGGKGSSAQQWAMEAFSHFTYHRSGGSLIVCDLQGRYKKDRYTPNKSRFELTDLAICSRARSFGPTDLGEKGIESFFFSHQCNEYCHANGKRWASPRNPRKWFEHSTGTSMISSDDAWKLNIDLNITFKPSLCGLLEEDEYEDD